MEPDTTNHMTLEYLLNPVYHSGVFQTKSKTNHLNDEISSTDLKFYRKRINALSRDMTRGNVNGTNQIVQEAHTAYVKAAIHYFKESDKSELLQNEYKNSDEDVERKGTQQQPIKNSNNKNKEDFDIDAANKALFETPATHPTLDTFVTSKTLKVAEPMKPPQRRQINLKTKEFRMKGLRSKKDKL